jgi:hypothetical protein
MMSKPSHYDQLRAMREAQAEAKAKRKIGADTTPKLAPQRQGSRKDAASWP